MKGIEWFQTKKPSLPALPNEEGQSQEQEGPSPHPRQVEHTVQSEENQKQGRKEEQGPGKALGMNAQTLTTP